MKNLVQFIKLTVVFSVFCMFSTSCEDIMGGYLDKPPGVDVTEDTIFSTRINAETFLVGIYQDGMYMDLPEWSDRCGRRDGLFSAFCDEAEDGASWYQSHTYNNAGITVNTNRDEGRWTYRWKAIRSINIILDRIDDVPDADQEYKNQVKGQALFIRGLCYFEMFKRYGGVPIVDFRFNLDDPEGLKVPRATLEETVNFIVNDAEQAAALLPDRWSAQFTGKITKGAAMMLKARTLLYAASPLSNTASPPLSLPGDDNKLICYGNTDLNRWKLAADAAKAVLDWASGAGVQLLTGSDRAYENTYVIPDNEEIILATKLVGRVQYWHDIYKCLDNFYITQSGTMITQNFVEKYEKKDGTPQTWNRNGGDNLAQLYSELDPRFDQSIRYNGCEWNNDFPIINMWEGAVPSNRPPLLDNKTGYWIRKWVPKEMNNTTNAYVYPNWHLYRLAEAYLIYAEAMNEYQGPVSEAYQAVNIIRNRVGMPDFPPGLTQEQFREKLRNERSIELAFEEHRLWDIMRWTIAEQEGVMQGNMWGIKIYKQPEPSTEFSYTYNVFEQRYWKAGMYHIPFYQNEVNKGYLIQNPGW